MSTTLERIKRNHLEARKARQKATVDILGAFLGDIETKKKRGQEVGESDVVAQLKKYIENAKQCGLDAEAIYLNQYLPTQMTAEELVRFFTEEIVGNHRANVGVLMKALKEAHGGEYDGKLASKIAKETLQSVQD